MSQSSAHLTETLEAAHVHHLGQFLNLPEPLCPAVKTSCLPVSAQRHLYTTWGGVVISDMTRGDGIQQIHVQLTPSTLPFIYLFLPHSEPSRPTQVSPGSSRRPCLLTLSTCAVSDSTHFPSQHSNSTVPFSQFPSTVPVVLTDANHGRGAHFPAMSPAPGTKSPAGSGQAELPLRKREARALGEKQARTGE